MCKCEFCGSTSAKGNLVDVYNEDDEGNGGVLLCDNCACGPRDHHNAYVMARPEGYYHMPIGTFD
jgi:hypothetical protein